MIFRKNLIILGATAFIPVFMFFCGLFGVANIEPWHLVASLLPLTGATIYVILKKLQISSKMLTLMHVGVWMFLFAGLIFEFKIPSYLGVFATLGAISFGIIQLMTLVGFVAIAFLFVFAATRKVWAANFAILSFCSEVFLMWSVAIFLPGAAAH